MVSPILKVNITNLTDGRYFAAEGVDYLSFSFDPDSPQYIDPDKVKEITSWLSGPEIVGEFNIHSVDEINRLVEYAGLQVAQLSQKYNATDHDGLNIPIIKKVIVDKSANYESLKATLVENSYLTKYFLLDLKTHQIEWEHIKAGTLDSGVAKVCAEFPVILDMDVDDQNITEVLELLHPAGINLVGGKEIKVGVKSFDDFDAIMEKIRN